MDSSRAKLPAGGATLVIESLYAVLALAAIVLFGLRETGLFGTETARLALYADFLICTLFISRAAWTLWRTPDRRGWWKWGWADILASIPEVELLRPLRFLRFLRLLMMIRLFRSTTRSVHGLATYFNVDRAQSVMATVFALIVVSVVTSSFSILGLEAKHPGANITTAEQAAWWSISTLFGAEPSDFGEHHAVTTGGRLIALWLTILSLGLIGSLAGLISAWIERAGSKD